MCKKLKKSLKFIGISVSAEAEFYMKVMATENFPACSKRRKPGSQGNKDR